MNGGTQINKYVPMSVDANTGVHNEYHFFTPCPSLFIQMGHLNQSINQSMLAVMRKVVLHPGSPIQTSIDGIVSCSRVVENIR
jgi:hypothetical protein